MNELAIFNYEGSEVRTLMIDGEPWWVLKDICGVLELSNSRVVSDRLEDDEVSQTYITDSLGREQETTIINEPGMYNVILRSDKPEAKKFKRWITHDVLPAIRRTGGYTIPGSLNLNPNSISAITTRLHEFSRLMENQKIDPKIIAEDMRRLYIIYGEPIPEHMVNDKPTVEQMSLAG